MAEPRARKAELLFVYGSLKRGQRHHRELGGARFVGTARTLPEYRLLDLGTYPALARGRRAIVGELFEIDAEAFERLDSFEGDAYVRGLVTLTDGRSVQTFFAVDAVVVGARELDGESWPPTSSE
jgi:gamma-glutamylaminecyclotransferase